MTYELSGLYFDEMSRAQQDEALVDLIADGAMHGFYGMPPQSDDFDYVMAYQRGEDARLAEIRSEWEALSRRIDFSGQRIEALGRNIAALKSDVGVLQVEVTTEIATLEKLDFSLTQLECEEF
jgi:septal ring factor EnvC (AmiA/AmiB activator)